MMTSDPTPSVPAILVLDEERHDGESDLRVIRRLMDERPGRMLEVLVSGPIQMRPGEALDGERRLTIGFAEQPR